MIAMGLAMDTTVRKGTRERRYIIRASGVNRIIGEVWFGRARHRQTRAAGVHDARMLADQFTREIRDLVTDGWTEGRVT